VAAWQHPPLNVDACFGESINVICGKPEPHHCVALAGHDEETASVGREIAAGIGAARREIKTAVSLA